MGQDVRSVVTTYRFFMGLESDHLPPPHEIVTAKIDPPVPTNAYDWEATFKDYDEGDPIGRGPTEIDAVEDLIEQCDKDPRHYLVMKPTDLPPL